MTAGAIIRRARLAEGLTQAQLARRLGITQPAIARLERAGDAVTIGTLQRALNAMNRTLELRSRQRPSSVDDGQVLEALRLTPAERLARFEKEYEHVRDFALEAQAQVSLGRVA